MKAIEISEVSALAPHVQPGCSEPLLLTDHGRVIATVVPTDEDDAQSMLLSINPTFGAILERSRRQAGIGGRTVERRCAETIGAPSETGWSSQRFQASAEREPRLKQKLWRLWIESVTDHNHGPLHHAMLIENLLPEFVGSWADPMSQFGVHHFRAGRHQAGDFCGSACSCNDGWFYVAGYR